MVQSAMRMWEIAIPGGFLRWDCLSSAVLLFSVPSSGEAGGDRQHAAGKNSPH